MSKAQENYDVARRNAAAEFKKVAAQQARSNKNMADTIADIPLTTTDEWVASITGSGLCKADAAVDGCPNGPEGGWAYTATANGDNTTGAVGLVVANSASGVTNGQLTVYLPNYQDLVATSVTISVDNL